MQRSPAHASTHEHGDAVAEVAVAVGHAHAAVVLGAAVVALEVIIAEAGLAQLLHALDLALLCVKGCDGDE